MNIDTTKIFKYSRQELTLQKSNPPKIEAGKTTEKTLLLKKAPANDNPKQAEKIVSFVFVLALSDFRKKTTPHTRKKQRGPSSNASDANLTYRFDVSKTHPAKSPNSIVPQRLPQTTTPTKVPSAKRAGTNLATVSEAPRNLKKRASIQITNGG